MPLAFCGPAESRETRRGHKPQGRRATMHTTSSKRAASRARRARPSAVPSSKLATSTSGCWAGGTTARARPAPYLERHRDHHGHRDLRSVVPRAPVTHHFVSNFVVGCFHGPAALRHAPQPAVGRSQAKYGERKDWEGHNLFDCAWPSADVSRRRQRPIFPARACLSRPATSVPQAGGGIISLDDILKCGASRRAPARAAPTASGSAAGQLSHSGNDNDAIWRSSQHTLVSARLVQR